MTQHQPPTISILVATWNCRELLGHFLASLQAQTYPHWQLLLLDNCSDDGTAELVFSHQQAHPNQSIVWSSRRDTGIYDAWNRGLTIAQGDYFCFLGADDVFVDNAALSHLADLATSRPELITARNAYYTADGRFLRVWGSRWQWQRMRQSMNIAHPGMLIHRSLFYRYGDFDCNYKICGDYEWLLRLPPEIKSVHIERPIMKIVQAGISHTRIRSVYAETFRAQRSCVGVVMSAVFWLVNWLKYWRRRLIGLA